MLQLNSQNINLNQIESVGFNTRDGRFALLSDGTKLAISFAEREMILTAFEAAEADDAFCDEQTLEDMAEFYQYGIQ